MSRSQYRLVRFVGFADVDADVDQLESKANVLRRQRFTGLEQRQKFVRPGGRQFRDGQVLDGGDAGKSKRRPVAGRERDDLPDRRPSGLRPPPCFVPDGPHGVGLRSVEQRGEVFFVKPDTAMRSFPSGRRENNG